MASPSDINPSPTVDLSKKEVEKDLKYDLVDVKLKFNDKVASCRLRTPSVLPRGSTTHGEDTAVVLDLILSDEDLKHNFKLMKELVHPNILHGRLVHKNHSEAGSFDNWGLVEPYTGLLSDYLEKDLAIPPSLKSAVVLLPHDILREIVRQLVDGLEHLMIHGYYHGNFTLKNTCYHQKPNGDVTVKLTGFKKKSEKISVCQKEDLWALGDALEEISDIAKEVNKAADANKSGLYLDTFQIDDLVKKLKLVTVLYSAQPRKTCPDDASCICFVWHCSGRRATSAHFGPSLAALVHRLCRSLCARARALLLGRAASSCTMISQATHRKALSQWSLSEFEEARHQAQHPHAPQLLPCLGCRVNWKSIHAIGVVTDVTE